MCQIEGIKDYICMFYLEGQFSVDCRHLGCHVHWGRRVGDEVLYGLVVVAFPAGHQVKDELEKLYRNQFFFCTV